jgi:hypothetical protein
VYYAHSRTVWKKTPDHPPEFYLTKIKLNWYSDIVVPEPLLMELAGYIDGYLEARRLEAKRKSEACLIQKAEVIPPLFWLFC